MKAVVITSYGDPSVLQMGDVPTPVPGNDQVLVRVHAIGVNPIELVARSGGFDWPVPVIIGFEFSGTVEAIGESVRGVRIGDRIAGWPDSPVHGSYAEYTLSSNFAQIPDGVGFEQAAASVIGPDNAARGLSLLALSEGETLVVTGASGALGSAAVQLARRAGVKVIGIAGPSSLAFVESLGATAVEYGDNLVDRVRAVAPQGVAAALDTSGRGQLPALIELRGGTDRVVTLADLEHDKYGVPLSHGHEGNRDNRVVAGVLEELAAGRWTSRVGRTFPLADAAAAHALMETGHTGGKVVLIP